MANFADGAIAIIGCRFDDYSDATGTVALERDFFVVRTFQLTRTALDRTLDIILRHIFCLGRGNSTTQPRIAIWISAAGPGSHCNFLDQARENLAAFSVGRALLVLNCGPF